MVAAALGVATYFALLRIAEAKSETAVGGEVIPLDAQHPAEGEAFENLRSRIAGMGDAALSDRLEPEAIFFVASEMVAKCLLHFKGMQSSIRSTAARRISGVGTTHRSRRRTSRRVSVPPRA